MCELDQARFSLIKSFWRATAIVSGSSFFAVPSAARAR
jgi:hypothetical protein